MSKENFHDLSAIVNTMIGVYVTDSISPQRDASIKRVCCIYTTEYYLSIKRIDTLSVRTKCMDLDNTVLSEIRQTHTNFACRYCLKTWLSI